MKIALPIQRNKRSFDLNKQIRQKSSASFVFLKLNLAFDFGYTLGSFAASPLLIPRAALITRKDKTLHPAGLSE
ncbi:hypothetical protein GWI33_007663 [Rhynchophorus ferrugineus]|uniref:Uncharacterized protein n=1 Tax=Rhynchophorus ferrugineus TaxID=354439 RepID=A0A834IJG6_RHYFE|nr:hypothetical protein GWI33_007663 [Rhynchophorus ferrugineus]